jgi:DnaJ-class molecular chaperone
VAEARALVGIKADPKLHRCRKHRSVSPLTKRSTAQPARCSYRAKAGKKSIEVKIPKGTPHGAKIRLAGEGLILNVSVAPHPQYTLTGRDLTTDVKLAPWQAALGDRVDVKTLDGTVSLNIPPGTNSGQKLRLKGKGLPNPKAPPGVAGDLFVRLMIDVSKELTDRERELYEQLKDASGEPSGPPKQDPSEGD